MELEQPVQPGLASLFLFSPVSLQSLEMVKRRHWSPGEIMVDEQVSGASVYMTVNKGEEDL